MKAKLSMRVTLLLFVMVPMAILALILEILTVHLTISNLEENTKEQLRVATLGLRAYYEYDLINDNALEDGFLEYAPEEYIDKIHEDTGLELTIFKDNVRFMTSLRNEDGSRNEGTTASDVVWAAVSQGKDFYSDDVVIGGKDYYVYYMPLTDGTTIYGMAFSGILASTVQDAKTRSILMVLAITTICGLLFAVLALIFANKVILTPFRKAVSGIDELSTGNISVRVEAKSGIKEITNLIGSTNKLSETLSGIVTDIQDAMDSLYSIVGTTTTLSEESSESSSQISEAMNQLAKSTELMSTSVQDINTNIIEMGNIVENAQDTILTLTESAGKMETANTDALACIESIAESSDNSAEAVGGIADMINSTNEAVNKITNMVNMITSIAGQTNLLALNASIEAARAGESGKGFAVVADNIKDLATQSSESANEIHVIVSDIVKLSNECVEQAATVKQYIEKEQELLSQTKGQFNTLSGEIQSSVQNIDTVGSIANQLGNIKDTIVGAISDLSAVSEETSATNEEVTASSNVVSSDVSDVSRSMNEISALAGRLKSVISFFKA
ncbi:MAG: methyl-accepting chemotaxis protein [Lachnospiraceae bacterium]|nr:methyl-accepting chemotaxis protein [Lachnospiraceae bacterium]